MAEIVLTGADGMLGKDLVDILGEAHTVLALTRAQLDLTNRDQVLERLKEIRPMTVVNCAAYTNVDGCEDNGDLARRVNALGPQFLAEAAVQTGAYLVQLSTDYVFDGSKPLSEAYREEDPPSPLNTYGRTKLEGEVFVRSITPEHLIVRTGWLYGRYGRSFIRSVLRQAIQGATLKVVDDQNGSPTWSRTLALQLRVLMESRVRGTVHASTLGYCTWFDLAREFLKYMGIEAKVAPCKTADYPRPASRPANAILDHRRLQILGLERMSPWTEDLKRFVEKHGQDFYRETVGT
jgi:dTDP-4-dehydrorhamnose reductase